jgi:multimeric flavodoxin WrbA
MSLARPLVILGSARQDGETRRAVQIAFEENADLVILNQYRIGSYDYAHGNEGDSFLGIVDSMLTSDAIIFATPVYWYAMSAPLKKFFDRLSDLTEAAQAKGRALAGKKVWVIATGTEAALPEGFEIPFQRTAEYFAMKYLGCAYLYTGQDTALRAASETAMARFGEMTRG